jgi:hypothetical protein
MALKLSEKEIRLYAIIAISLIYALNVLVMKADGAIFALVSNLIVFIAMKKAYEKAS